MANHPPITPEHAVDYSLCNRKAYLLLRGDDGEAVHPYVTLMETHASTGLKTFLESSKRAGLRVQNCRGKELAGKADVFSDVLIRADELQATVDALVPLEKPVGKGLPSCEPYLAIGSFAVAHEDKIRLAFIAHVLTNGRRNGPSVGSIINPAGVVQRIPLVKAIATLEPVIETLKAWRTSLPTAPPVILNDHCPICPFKKLCLEQAEKDDGLTLLDRMTPKIMQRYHRKGIFTVTQLSYVFRPRRQRKKQEHRPPTFNFELQALALRANKIYLHQAPAIPQHVTEMFLDMEGIPDHGSHYLIGLVIRTQEQVERHSFWADASKDEKGILAAFVAIANQHPDAPIYHYGSYEPKALEQMGKASGISVDAVVGRLVNVSTFIFGKVYFPCRSNSLKDLGRFCGAVWKSPDASGLMSVVWRMKWQASRSHVLKQQLLDYNIDDCNALVLLLSELRKIGQSGNARSDVDYADTRKWNTTPSGQQIHDSLESILKSAHARYKDNRIGIRQPGEGTPTKRGAKGQHQFYRRIVPVKASAIVRVKRPISCHRSTAHKGCRLEVSDRIAEHMVTDLAFGKSGCRKTVTKYFGTMGYCPKCELYSPPPAIRRMKKMAFGHCFRAWAVYQRIILRLPYRVISQVLYDLFNEQISVSGVVGFLSDLAAYYASTERILLKKILASPFVHVDETKLNIQGTNHYVWVLTDGKHVVFRLTETRETSLIQELLNGYTGILICDFYGGYDACACRQQRCLVHLIRDLNDDLWKNPFDTELEGFVSAVGELITPIMADVDSYGLKRRNLHKHQRSVDRFFKNVIDSREYKCEITQTYQKRFLRYKDSLFRFLTEDGIPWNNNMAERAIRHLAVQRKISGSFFKRVAEHYLVLLGIAQSCRFQDKSFLRFLLSEQKDVDEFKEKKRLKATELVVKKAGGDVDLTEQLQK